MRFADRADAGRRLAERLGPLPEDVVVLGLARGGVPVAAEVAAGRPFEALVVRKLGLPARPEFAIGALGEGGSRVLDEAAVRAFRVPPQALASLESRERAELDRRVRRYRGETPLPELDGRTVVIVDDGIATGATAIAACRTARAAGAARIIVAVPVAAPDAPASLTGEADEVVSVLAPGDFRAVGEWYERFGEVTDEEVLAALGR